MFRVSFELFFVFLVLMCTMLKWEDIVLFVFEEKFLNFSLYLFDFSLNSEDRFQSKITFLSILFILDV